MAKIIRGSTFKLSEKDFIMYPSQFKIICIWNVKLFGMNMAALAKYVEV